MTKDVPSSNSYENKRKYPVVSKYHTHLLEIKNKFNEFKTILVLCDVVGLLHKTAKFDLICFHSSIIIFFFEFKSLVSFM